MPVARCIASGHVVSSAIEERDRASTGSRDRTIP
jgi:hypothetical protein